MVGGGGGKISVPQRLLKRFQVRAPVLPGGALLLRCFWCRIVLLLTRIQGSFGRRCGSGSGPGNRPTEDRGAGS